MNTLFINTVEYTTCISGLQELKLKVTKSREGAFDVALSSQVVARGDLFDYLENVFFIDANGRDAEVIGDVYIGCCGTTYQFRITSDLIEYCPLEREMKFPFQLYNTQTERYDRFRERILWYQNDDTKGSADFLAAVPPYMLSDDSTAFANGPTKYLHSFNVFEAIAHNANLCGLNFVSSILTSDPYDRLLFLPAHQFETPIILPVSIYIEDNLPNLTPTQLLEILSPVFNAEFRFIGDTVYFERYDYFDSSSYTAFDAEVEYPKGNINELCYKYSTDKADATLTMEYRADPIDDPSGEVLEDYNFTKVYDSSSRFLKGTRNVSLRFAPANFAEAAGGNELGLKRNKSSLPKLLLREPGQTGRTPGFVNQLETSRKTSFREDVPDSLYNNFYSIDDPISSTFIKWEVGDFKFTPSEQSFCEVVTKILDENEEVGFDTRYGTAIAEEYEIEFSKATVTLKKINILP